MWPAWEWVSDPTTKWLCGSYAEKLSIRDSLKMRRLIQSRWYQERWGRGFNLVDNSDWGDPEGFELSGDQNQKIRFENDRTGYRIAFGAESGVMGDGGNRILVDDWHDRQGAYSDKERETALVTFDEAVSTRLNDPITDPIVIIGQRLHEEDISGHLLAKGGYELLLIPMHYDPQRSRVTCIGWKDPRTEAGELMHSARFPEQTVAEIEVAIGPEAAAGQLEQRPAPAGGGILKREGWRFYNDDELPDVFDLRVQSWDLAFKKTALSNFVAGQEWGRAGARCYLFDGEVYKRLDFNESCEEFKAFAIDHPCATKLVEDAANGPALESELRLKVPGITLVPAGGGVVAVAHSVSPYVAAGNVWLPNPYFTRADTEGRVPITATVRPERRWVLRLIANAATFPNGSIPPGSHGDDVSAMVQALHHLMHGKKPAEWSMW